jgi:MFS transporter, OCT family, solute carrier family 22 (organic cation transporter), member 4/5
LDGYARDRSDYTDTMVAQFSLVCDRHIVVAIIQSFYFLGQAVGSIVFGSLSDKIGRKPVFGIAILLLASSGLCMTFVPSWSLAAFVRFLTGLSVPGVYVISVVMGAEFVGPKYRVWTSVLPGICWAIGLIIMGSLAYYLRDYRPLQLTISIPALLLLIYWWWVPESARWLMSQGRYADVDRILARVAKCNGKPPLPPDWYRQLVNDAPQKLSFIKGFIALFRTPRLRIRTLILFLVWAVATMSYYGLAINLAFIGSDNRLGFILGGVVQIPGLLVVLAVNFIGRKLLTVFAFWSAAACLALTLAVPKNELFDVFTTSEYGHGIYGINWCVT